MLKLLLQKQWFSMLLIRFVEFSVTELQGFVIIHRFLLLFFHDENSGFCCPFFECKSKIHLRSEIFIYMPGMSVFLFSAVYFLSSSGVSMI